MVSLQGKHCGLRSKARRRIVARLALNDRPIKKKFSIFDGISPLLRLNYLRTQIPLNGACLDLNSYNRGDQVWLWIGP